MSPRFWPLGGHDSPQIPGTGDQQVCARDIASRLGEQIIQRSQDVLKTPRMPGGKSLWWAADAVFQKAWGDHIHRDAFGHEQLRVAARQHVHTKFGDVIWGSHDVRLNAITGGVS